MATKKKTKRSTNKTQKKRKSKFVSLDGMFKRSFQEGGKILNHQTGGGYIVDVSTNIGNRPAIVGYADHAPPIYVNGHAIFGEGINPVCGQQTGGHKNL